ncbi:MAG: YhcH/YjgK/YiaL family protein [Treponemataceae bacterium]
MIVASLKQLGRYKALSKNFADAIAWIETGVWKKLADGRHEIDGKRFYAMAMTGETKPLEECKHEVHRKYADIQIILEGAEYIMVRDSNGMPIMTPYVEDIEFLHDGPKAPEHRVALEPGVAAIFFPEDSHKPGVSQSGKIKTRKVVVKVAV